MKTLGARIAHYRQAAGLSQAALASACGWSSQSRVGNYEKDLREPTIGDITNMAKVLGVIPELLLLNSSPIQANNSDKLVTLLEPSQIEQYLAGQLSTLKNAGPQSSLIRKATEASEKTFALEWQGDGMRPRIERGDTVYIDPAQNDFTGDGVYLFTLGGKKPSYELGTLQETPRGLMLHFDNPAPGWEALPVEPEQCVGKVVAFIPKWLS